MTTETGRPKWEEAFERWRRPVGFVVAPIAALAIWFAPLPDLSPAAHKLAALLVLAILLWVTEAIPMAATSLLVPALCIVFGVGSLSSVMAPFASGITFLFIGTFMLGMAMQKHGLDRRMALRLLTLPGVSRSTFTVFIALGALTGGLSMWMSNSGTTAVMLPIALGILRACPELGDSARLRENVILLVAFSASMGGLATPVGTPPNLIALSALREHAGITLTFFQWVQLALPLTVVLLIFLFLRLRPPPAPRPTDPARIRAEFARQLASLGPRKRGETQVAVVFAVAVFLWVWPGLVEMLGFKGRFGGSWIRAHFPEDLIGLLAGLSLLLLPADLRKWEMNLEWHEAARIDWGTILLFGGGLALGSQLFQTGLAVQMGHEINAMLGSPSLWTLVAVAICASIALSEAASNTASANIMVPMMIAVAAAQGLNPIPVALATALACSFGFMLPVSTGPNAQAYATRQVRIVAMMRQGIWLDIFGAVVIWLIVRFLAPVLGWS